MLWPITIAGKTMPLLGLADYQNPVHICINVIRRYRDSDKLRKLQPITMSGLSGAALDVSYGPIRRKRHLIHSVDTALRYYVPEAASGSVSLISPHFIAGYLSIVVYSPRLICPGDICLDIPDTTPAISILKETVLPDMDHSYARLLGLVTDIITVIEKEASSELAVPGNKPSILRE